MSRLSEGIGVLCVGVMAFVVIASFFFWWAGRILKEMKKDEWVYVDENQTEIPITDIPERHL